ncbi:MAG: hypothetical protein DMG80_05430 [Acidobacteria bacterium]|nr:MAG: hypothetical protein DMG80_05430 [Acidobacteriota bacterium]
MEPRNKKAQRRDRTNMEAPSQGKKGSITHFFRIPTLECKKGCIQSNLSGQQLGVRLAELNN